MVEGFSVKRKEEPKYDKIREPEEPSKVLLAHIDLVPDKQYSNDLAKQEEVKKRRELIRACAEKIEVIGAELARAFINTYAKYGLHITGGVRFYIVGGRLEGKPLGEGSDLDCAFTVVNSAEDVRPKPGDEPREVYAKKAAARKEFAFTVLDQIVTKHGFMIEDVLPDGEKIVGSLIEPKEYGCSDEEFRKNNLPALLIVAVK